MIVSFKDKATKDIFNGRLTSPAKKRLARTLWAVASRKLDQLDSASSLDDLRIPPGNRLKALKADRSGQHSIRINDQFRLCFTWSASGPRDVEITDYH